MREINIACKIHRWFEKNILISIEKGIKFSELISLSKKLKSRTARPQILLSGQNANLVHDGARPDGPFFQISYFRYIRLRC